MPAAAIPAVLGAVGVGGSIFSGITGASAATKAAQIQSQAAQQAGQQVRDAAAAVNPGITSAAQQSGQQVQQAASAAGTGITTAAQQAGQGVTGATTQANSLLDPYARTGEQANSDLNAGLQTGGLYNKIPTAADIQMDPGFEARLQAGQKVLERSAAARGGAASGTALMDLNNYAQTNASQEFGAAYNRFLQTRQQNFDFQNTVAGRGAATAGAQGQNLIGAGKYAGDTSIDAAKAAGSLNVGGAEYAGDKTYNAATTTANNTLNAAGQSADYLTQGANAQAAGTVGRANAITGAISSGMGAVGSAAGIYNSLKYPGATGAAQKGPYYNPNGTTTNPDGSITVRRTQ